MKNNKKYSKFLDIAMSIGIIALSIQIGKTILKEKEYEKREQLHLKIISEKISTYEFVKLGNLTIEYIETAHKDKSGKYVHDLKRKTTLPDGRTFIEEEEKIVDTAEMKLIKEEKVKIK